jgi:hypothetical protein
LDAQAYKFFSHFVDDLFLGRIDRSAFSTTLTFVCIFSDKSLFRLKAASGAVLPGIINQHRAL